MILTHRPTGTTAQASERRTQGENRRVALHRLRLELALTIRRPIRHDADHPYSPSPLWRERCRGGRIDVNPEHDDFPALLAEALDVLFARDDDPKDAARLARLLAVAVDQIPQVAPRALGSSMNAAERPAGTLFMMRASVRPLGGDGDVWPCAPRLYSQEEPLDATAPAQPGRCREGGQLLGGQFLERSVRLAPVPP